MWHSAVIRCHKVAIFCFHKLGIFSLRVEKKLAGPQKSIKDPAGAEEINFDE